jgi:hypothetical protein
MAGDLQSNLKKALKGLKPKDITKIKKVPNMDKIQKISEEIFGKGSRIQSKAMGGVVNTTKAMPVGMMDGGKVKPMKMNMGGVAKGRGGMFKGIR